MSNTVSVNPTSFYLVGIFEEQEKFHELLALQMPNLFAGIDETFNSLTQHGNYYPSEAFSKPEAVWQKLSNRNQLKLKEMLTYEIDVYQFAKALFEQKFAYAKSSSRVKSPNHTL